MSETNLKFFFSLVALGFQIQFIPYLEKSFVFQSELRPGKHK